MVIVNVVEKLVTCNSIMQFKYKKICVIELLLLLKMLTITKRVTFEKLRYDEHL